MITREDVADLRVGDVVEVTHEDWPEGTVVRGPLWMVDGETLQVSRIVVRHWDGRHPFDTGLTLTVVSRTPRPLYVNSDKTEPDPGDVVRDAIYAEPTMWAYKPRSGNEFVWLDLGRNGIRLLPSELPTRLRLLVDGRTGQVVP